MEYVPTALWMVPWVRNYRTYLAVGKLRNLVVSFAGVLLHYTGNKSFTHYFARGPICHHWSRSKVIMHFNIEFHCFNHVRTNHLVLNLNKRLTSMKLPDEVRGNTYKAGVAGSHILSGPL